jgi:hypothetical protein
MMLCVGGAVMWSGCGGGASRVHPVKIDASAAATGAMELYDKNADGALDDDELSAVPGIKKYLSHYDRDSDGKVSRDEIAARLESWGNQKLALFSAPLAIRLDGRPLGDAEITLVPESYLGPNVKPATGITMDNGLANLSHADEDLPKSSNGRPIPGVFAGTYKVQVTHAGRRIPAKYNTATVLGEEVAHDINQDDNPIIIDLKSN